MKVAYFVSRFPHTTETFILRELNAVSGVPNLDVELFSLFRAPRRAIVHPGARRWMSGVHRPRPLRALADVVWWSFRRPRSVLHAFIAVWNGYAGHSGSRLRALITVVIGCSHARAARRLGVQHVHAHYSTYPALAAWVCWRMTGIPYSFTAHAHDLYITEAMLLEKVTDARFVVTISEFNRRLLVSRAASSTPLFVVRCGIDLSQYPFRERRLPGDGPIRAVCVASLQEYKGHSVLLNALASSEGCLRRVELALVGDGPLRSVLERQVADLGLEDRVSFFGSLPEPQVAAMLQEADLFVLPSVVARTGQMEGLPVALIEAVACGVPVVTSRLSGIPEVVTDDVGVLVEPGDVIGLRSALERVVNGEAPFRSAEGRRRVEEEFDVRRSARQLASLFDRSGGGFERPDESATGRAVSSPSSGDAE